MKKILIALLLIIIAAGGFFFYMSIDQYDKSQYSASTSKGFERGSFMKFKLPNPSDKDVFLDSSILKLIVVFEKEQGHMFTEYLASKPKDFMKSKYAMLVLDITKIPVAVRNTFVLPTLRSNSYPTALIPNDKLANVFKDPVNGDKIHIISVINNRVMSIEFASTKEELDKILK